ncbi:MAG: hypothetical protein DRI70_02280 [Bacteroidetes bacterium]|nr:MAG: hypothetical protein DRI70_02280 [Bacteroidota bacterium]
MKKILIIAVALISFSGIGQSKYKEGMTKAFDLWKSEKHWEAANLFERIGQVEMDNWLPPFYVAQINVIYSFGEKDEKALTAQLNKAQDFINDAKAISKNNSEILVVQAQLYTAWVAFDGQRYGMTYSQKIAQLYNEAYILEPGNPRVASGKVEWDMGTARFFGQDTAPFCEDLAKAVELFTTYEPKGDFYPQGGEEYARGSLARNCKE